MKLRYFAYLLLISSFYITGCKESNNSSNDNQTNSKSNEEKSTVISQMLELKDSIESYQKKAFALEEEKISSTTALIDEVKNVVTGYDAATLMNIQKQLDVLKAKKYTKETLDDESVMLAYDDACDSLVNLVQLLATETEDFSKYNRANLLINDILDANSQDFFVRKDYNSYVLDYNNLLEANKSTIEASGSQELPLEKYPLFYGELES
ncbi:hypothetical protein [Chondrinema litorale]|uniref:hypothetical protein n=1 Tax=Chondrinema litorale TaxID=2994555 RepID=UPI002542CCEA|nr:hypothetical protein [Chondrinema litorale]UZR92962.1 hypothetical protein OQ292_13955 [Chondrinema litorale]